MTLRRDRKKGRKKSPNPANFKSKCLNCGGEGPHFVPPSFGDSGFYTCKRDENLPELKVIECARIDAISLVEQGILPDWRIKDES